MRDGWVATTNTLEYQENLTNTPNIQYSLGHCDYCIYLNTKVDKVHCALHYLLYKASE